MTYIQIAAVVLVGWSCWQLGRWYERDRIIAELRAVVETARGLEWRREHRGYEDPIESAMIEAEKAETIRVRRGVYDWENEA